MLWKVSRHQLSQFFQLVLGVVAEFLPVVAFCCALSHRLVLTLGSTASPFGGSWWLLCSVGLSNACELS